MTLVGITIGATEQPSVVAAFTESVIAAGGTPVLIPSALGDTDRVDEALNVVDVLLLSGGGDIHPAEYGHRVHSTLDSIDRQRDQMEMRAFRAARQADKRVLGVCRGAQLITVATGGSLIQDLAAQGYRGHIDENHDRGYATLRHGIKAQPGSCAEKILMSLHEVNTHHHQAVDDVGTLLIATAWSDDGVIEAVEAPGVLGVQWHPEALVANDDRYLEPFRWLIQGQ